MCVCRFTGGDLLDHTKEIVCCAKFRAKCSMANPIACSPGSTNAEYVSGAARVVNRWGQKEFGQCFFYLSNNSLLEKVPQCEKTILQANTGDCRGKTTLWYKATDLELRYNL